MERLPTLITYRSAEVMRQESIQWAYRRAGLYVGMLIFALSMAAAARTVFIGADDFMSAVLFLVGLASLAAAAYCGTTMDYPHFPRLSLDELAAMRDDMGLPAVVFQQTHDAVIHGTAEDRFASRRVDEIIAKIQQTGQTAKKGNL